MKKTLSFTLMFVALGLAGQRCAQAVEILGVAAQYNVFLFGDLNLSYTDVEGRAAAGGNVTLDHFGIGTRVNTEIPSVPSLVAGGNVSLNNGSVGCVAVSASNPPGPPNPGCIDEKKGIIVYGGTATLTPPVTSGPLTGPNPTFIDFAKAKTDITQLSNSWKGFTATGFDTDATNNFNLKANDLTATQNVFNLQSTAFVTTGASFNFQVAPGSTVLVNVLGDSDATHSGVIELANIGFFFNGVKAEEASCLLTYCHDPLYPFSNILFNFPDATQISLDHIGFSGSLIAPSANINSPLDLTDPANPKGTSHVDGNLIAMSLTGSTESHAIPFQGTISAVPEPTTLLLFAGGLLGMIARRRRV